MSSIGDIVERETGVHAPPVPPSVPNLEKKTARLWKRARNIPSRDGGSRTGANLSSVATTQPQPPPQLKPKEIAEDEGDENLKRVKQMNADEISQAQQELAGLDPDIVANLRRRAEAKAAARSTATHAKSTELENLKFKDESLSENQRSGSQPIVGRNTVEADALRQPFQEPTAAEDWDTRASINTHFPPPPEELRQYFPYLPVETSKLAWMSPVSNEEEEEYSESLVTIAPSELRFDFRGNVLTPRQSRLVPVDRGLHHHGDAPSAAGYTIPELAHLSRSSNASQRAIAIRTLGRVLHKLRLRRFAKSSELQLGLEELVRATRAMETLTEAASDKTTSLTVRSYATEALWLAKADFKSS